MTKVELCGMTAKINGDVWESDSPGFKKWLNAFCSAAVLEGYYPDQERAMLLAAKNFFKNITVLEEPGEIKQDVGNIVE